MDVPAAAIAAPRAARRFRPSFQFWMIVAMTLFVFFVLVRRQFFSEARAAILKDME